ncbi:unnamed protein product [Allacma fusca]|uniref:Uncharacterized protein n=1 Tax=Allacma fusca TaxID=39272 RepID=A0A8J2NKW0_9HEXA|nr:unnamed protein product [Allacma fusca]
MNRPMSSSRSRRSLTPQDRLASHTEEEEKMAPCAEEPVLPRRPIPDLESPIKNINIIGSTPPSSAFSSKSSSMENILNAGSLESAVKDLGQKKTRQKPTPLKFYTTTSAPDFARLTSQLSLPTSGSVRGSTRGLTILSPMTPSPGPLTGSPNSGQQSYSSTESYLESFLSDMTMTYVNIRSRQNKTIQLPKLVRTVKSPNATNFFNYSSSVSSTSESVFKHETQVGPDLAKEWVKKCQLRSKKVNL